MDIDPKNLEPVQLDSEQPTADELFPNVHVTPPGVTPPAQPIPTGNLEPVATDEQLKSGQSSVRAQDVVNTDPDLAIEMLKNNPVGPKTWGDAAKYALYTTTKGPFWDMPVGAFKAVGTAGRAGWDLSTSLYKIMKAADLGDQGVDEQTIKEGQAAVEDLKGAMISFGADANHLMNSAGSNIMSLLARTGARSYDDPLTREQALQMLRGMAASERTQADIQKSNMPDAAKDLYAAWFDKTLSPEAQQKVRDNFDSYTPEQLQSMGVDPEKSQRMGMIPWFMVPVGRFVPEALAGPLSEGMLRTAALPFSAAEKVMGSAGIQRTLFHAPMYYGMWSALRGNFEPLVAGLGIRWAGPVAAIGMELGADLSGQMAGFLKESGIRAGMTPLERQTLAAIEQETGGAPSTFSRMAMNTAGAAAHGAVQMAPFAAGAQSPEDFWQTIGTGAGMGATFGLAHDAASTTALAARKALFDTVAKTPQGTYVPLSTESFNTDEPELDRMHANETRDWNPDNVDLINMQRHFLQGTAKPYALSTDTFDSIFGVGENGANRYGVVKPNPGGDPYIFYRGEEGFENAKAHEPLHMVRPSLTPAERNEVDQSLIARNDPSVFASQYFSRLKGEPVQVDFNSLPDRVADPKDPLGMTKEKVMDEMMVDALKNFDISKITKNPSLKSKLQMGLGQALESLGIPTTTHEVNSLTGVTPSITAISILENAIRRMAVHAEGQGVTYYDPLSNVPQPQPAAAAEQPTQPGQTLMLGDKTEQPQQAPKTTMIDPAIHFQDAVRALQALGFDTSEAQAKASTAIDAARELGINVDLGAIVKRALSGKFPVEHLRVRDAQPLPEPAAPVVEPQVSPEDITGAWQHNFMQDRPESYQFMPSGHPDAIHSPAIKADDLTFAGDSWLEAAGKARKFGLDPEAINRATHGFVTRKGQFKDSQEARAHAEEIGQMPEEAKDTLNPQDFAEERRFMPRDDQVQTPEFKKWFGDSKITDDRGKPLIVYHGTNQSIDSFNKDRLAGATFSQSSKEGFFFTDNPDVAHEYADNAAQRVVSNVSDFETRSEQLKSESERLEGIAKKTGNQSDWNKANEAMSAWEDYEIGATREEDTGQNIIPAYLSMRNPFVVNAGGRSPFELRPGFTDLIKQAKDNGHDGVIFKELKDAVRTSGAANHYVVFDSAQIKSATGNRGTFDPDNPDIRFMPSDDLKEVADKFGLQYIGDMGGTRKLHIYNDPRTKSTIALTPEMSKETAENKINASREAFDKPPYQKGLEFMPFYSQLERTLDKQPEKSSPEQIRAAIMQGSKKAEREGIRDHLGTTFDQYLKDNPKASKSQMLDFVRENQVQVKEVGRGQFTDQDIASHYLVSPEEWQGMSEKEKQSKRDDFDEEPRDPAADTKFGPEQSPNLNLPGGRDYGETLVTLPQKLDTVPRFPHDKYSITPIDPEEQPNLIKAGITHQIVSESGAPYFSDSKARVEEAYNDTHNIKRDTPQFESQHWDEPNVVVHLRHNIRDILAQAGEEAKKMFLLEEIQSDLHAKGRREGYNTGKLVTADDFHITQDPKSGLYQLWDNARTDAPIASAGGQTAIETTRDTIVKNAKIYSRERGGVPDLPFKGNAWKTLGLKIALRKAIESGADHLGWTTGEQQAGRYDLSKQVDNVQSHLNDDGTFDLDVNFKSDGPHAKFVKNISKDKLSDYVGKDLADRISAYDGPTANWQGQDLKVGGEGMKGFYDKELPNIANDLVKKWGVRVGTSEIETPDQIDYNPRRESQDTAIKTTVHSLPITDAMKRDIIENGQPLFMPKENPNLEDSQWAVLDKNGALRYTAKSRAEANAAILMPGDRVKEIPGAPIQPELGLQFMPSNDSDAIARSAVRDRETGIVYPAKSGYNVPHWMFKNEYPDQLDDLLTLKGHDKYEYGYVDNGGNFLNKQEAHERAKQQNQVGVKNTAYKGGLESNEFSRFMPATLNIGTKVGDTGSVSPEQILESLPKGVRLLSANLHDSNTEPTVVAQIHRPLTDEEANNLSATLGQGAIAQLHKNKGELYGPKADEWKPFNSDYFLMPDGKTHSDHQADQWGELYQHLPPEQRATVQDRNIQKIKDWAAKLPTISEGEDIALKGAAKKTWYQDSAKAIADVFGPDSDRFAALLAALSPQVDVPTNFQNALHTWNQWLEEGKPTNRDDIERIVAENITTDEKKNETKALKAWTLNSIRALTADDPSGLQLSGPKVDSFAQNLRGNLNAVTNDRWMMYYGTGDASKPMRNRNQKGYAIPGFDYLALSAHIRQVADALTKRTGEKWTPAEAQAAIWSYVRTIKQLADSKGMTPKELLTGTKEEIPVADTVDFARLINEPKYQQDIEKARRGAQGDFQEKPVLHGLGEAEIPEGAAALGGHPF